MMVVLRRVSDGRYRTRPRGFVGRQRVGYACSPAIAHRLTEEQAQKVMDGRPGLEMVEVDA